MLRPGRRCRGSADRSLSCSPAPACDRRRTWPRSPACRDQVGVVRAPDPGEPGVQRQRQAGGRRRRPRAEAARPDLEQGPPTSGRSGGVGLIRQRPIRRDGAPAAAGERPCSPGRCPGPFQFPTCGRDHATPDRSSQDQRSRGWKRIPPVAASPARPDRPEAARRARGRCRRRCRRRTSGPARRPAGRGAGKGIAPPRRAPGAGATLIGGPSPRSRLRPPPCRTTPETCSAPPERLRMPAAAWPAPRRPTGP